MCLGLQSDRKETLTLVGTADILVPQTKCRPQMFLCAHVWLPGVATVSKINPEHGNINPKNGTNFENGTNSENGTTPENGPSPENESHPENDYKCKGLTGIVQCTAGEFWCHVNNVVCVYTLVGAPWVSVTCCCPVFAALCHCCQVLAGPWVGVGCYCLVFAVTWVGVGCYCLVFAVTWVV